jgi:uncharacterized protein (DUF1501 family)
LAAASGTVGHKAQILNLLDDTLSFTAPPASTLSYPHFSPGRADDNAVAAWLKARTERFAKGVGTGPANNQRISDRFEAMERAGRLKAEAVDLLSTLNLGASASAAQAGALSVELLNADLCSAVIFDTRHDWDTHAAHALQHAFYQATFIGLDQLMSDLAARGMLADTMVAVLSEMTKTPRVNASQGKDHWPHSSALLLGAGIQGGRIYGGYNSLMESSKVDYATGDVTDSGDLLKYDNFIAGLLSACDVDPGGWLPGVPSFDGFLSA